MPEQPPPPAPQPTAADVRTWDDLATALAAAKASTKGARTSPHRRPGLRGPGTKRRATCH